MPHPKANSFSILMEGSRCASVASALPPKIAKVNSGEQCRGDWQLHNDLIDFLNDQGLGFATVPGEYERKTVREGRQPRASRRFTGRGSSAVC